MVRVEHESRFLLKCANNVYLTVQLERNDRKTCSLTGNTRRLIPGTCVKLELFSTPSSKYVEYKLLTDIAIQFSSESAITYMIKMAI